MNMKALRRAQTAMLKGGMNPKQIDSFITDVRQSVVDDRVEVMFLMSALALRRELKWGQVRIRRHLRAVDDLMKEFVADDFDLDKLRVQVFEETGFMMAANEEDEKHIVEVLRAAGYKVITEDEDEDKEV